jgi:peptide/nickel transport system permease protein
MTGRLRSMPPVLVLLVSLHVLALGADPLAPYPPNAQHRDRSYAPPTRLHLVDADGRWHVVPFVYGLEETAGGWRENAARRYPLRLFAQVEAYTIAGVIPATRRVIAVDPPAHLFLLGTDRYGRDLFSRLLVGARLSLFAGLLATLVALALGVAVGAVSGFAGGWPDRLLTWLATACLSLPSMYLLLAARSLLPLDLAPGQAFLVTAALIGALGWGRPAMLVRAVVRTERERDYVVAARSCGASPSRILARHVVPQSSGLVFTQAALIAPRFVLAEITLSLLGLGVGEPTASWGTLAAAMIPPGQVLAHWWLATPLAAIAGLFALYDRAARHLERRPASTRQAAARLVEAH